MVKITEIHPMEFEAWLNHNGYRQISEIKENMIINGHTEEEIQTEIDRLTDEYNDYIEDMLLGEDV